MVGSRKRRYNLSGSRRRGRSAAYSTPFRFGSSTGDLGAHRGTCDVDAGTPGPRWGQGWSAQGASGLGPTAALPFGGAAPAFGTDSGLEAFSRNPADVASRRRPFERTKIPEVPIDRSSRTESNYRCGRPIHREGKTNLSHDGLNPAHVPFRRVNNPTLGEFCFAMIGRADIEGSKSDVAKNAWPPQASYPFGNFSDTSGFRSRTTKGSLGHSFEVRIITGDRNQGSFYPYVRHEISLLVELPFGHPCCLLTDVPPQPNSPPNDVFGLGVAGRGPPGLP